MLRPTAGRQGYQKVDLDDVTCAVHTLVLNAFVGPRPAGHECRHLDGDPANNALTNLAWGTHAENYRDKVRHGSVLRGAKVSNSKLQEADVLAIRASSDTHKALAARFGIARSLVSTIRSGKAWAHIPMVTP
jgi:hypothetical protein